MSRDINQPFDIFNGRIMISLGPLTDKKHCPYSCSFCYVPSGFLQYSSLSIDAICFYLQQHQNEFDIIYISGDTDSFASPRLNDGLILLERLASEFSKDILITTRTSMETGIINRISKINETLAKKEHYLFVCISISSPDGNRDIEPFPIPSVSDRITTLSMLKNNGICTILAMRPFLPIYHANDYIKLIDLLAHNVDLILGEVWYHDPEHIMWKKLTGNTKVSRGNSRRTSLPFNNSTKTWEKWDDPLMEKAIVDYCKTRNIPFFMESAPAVEYLRSLTPLAVL